MWRLGVGISSSVNCKGVVVGVISWITGGGLCCCTYAVVVVGWGVLRTGSSARWGALAVDEVDIYRNICGLRRI